MEDPHEVRGDQPMARAICPTQLGLTKRAYPTDEFDAATVIEVSTRGTLRSDTWLMWLAEKLVPRSYHLLDYDFH